MSKTATSSGEPSGRLTIQLLSGWGPREHGIGLSEIELLDEDGCVLLVPAACVSAGNARNQSNHPAVLFNGEPQTKETKYMWSCEGDSERPVELCVDTSGLETKVSGLRIWNWNKASDREIRGVKVVRVYSEASMAPLFHGEIPETGFHDIDFSGDDKAKSRCSCYKKMKRGIATMFTRYGRFVAHHPLPFIIIPILVSLGLGLGLLALETESDMETVYFPKNSRAIKDRQVVRDTFPDTNNFSYNPFSQSDLDEAVTLLFKSKEGDIFNATILAEVESIVNKVKAITAVTSDGRKLTFDDVCARAYSECVVDGIYALNTSFQADLAAGRVTYPYWDSAGENKTVFTAISGVKTHAGGVLESATVLKITFKLTSGSEPWQKEFLSLAENLRPVKTEVVYETPDSLNDELNKSTSGDVWLFSLTITLMLTYACMVSSGGNPVSTRAMLAYAGVLSAWLGILGAMGLLSLCGVKYVDIVGVIPFLVIGIGVDDMFLMMSSWSETLGLTQLTVPARVGETFAKAGIGITITSLTDFLAFIIGTTSVFRSVTNFSLYAGVSVLFCYICNATLFGGCLTYHGHRVYASRHFLSCRTTKSRDKLMDEGRAKCYAVCCGGTVPAEERADESICEKLPRIFLPKVLLNNVVRIFIAIGFLGYLAAAVYGTINLKQGLVLHNLVLRSSYCYRFLEMDEKYFPTRIPIGFIVHDKIDYSGTEGVKFQELLHQARGDSEIDSSFERCWLSSYQNSTLYDASSSQKFVTNLLLFLTTSEQFLPDVIFDRTKTEIIASRCFVMSEPMPVQYDQADLMVRMRDLADASPLPVFAYHAAFVAYEQFLAVLPATLQMVGCAVAVMFVVTFIFLPHVLMVCLVTLTIIMILVGIFGFMYYWDISLSSITMIHLVMSVGFSVDFSAHVCAAYLVSKAGTRQARAQDAITHAAGPILNGAVSTLLGVILLVFSDSYIFTSFFNIMFLVIVFGMLHAVLFLPLVLSIIGPQSLSQSDRKVNATSCCGSRNRSISPSVMDVTETTEASTVGN